MGFHPRQFRDLVERTLTVFDPPLAGPVAVELVLGTAAQESQLGRFLRQEGGPAIGAFQCEPVTFRWLRDKYKLRYPELTERQAYELEWDLRLAIIFCRLRYRAAKAPLPSTAEPALLGAYWKEHYNTKLGKGTVEQFVDSWEKLLGK